MTQTPDVEAAVERVTKVAQGASAEHKADLCTLLASHAALVKQAQLDGEALKPFAKLWDQISEDDRVRRAWQVQVRTTSDAVRKARARLQAREGGVS